MNVIIIRFLKDAADRNKIKYRFLANSTGIKYSRLLNIFKRNATISASKLICLCRVLRIKQSELMALLDEPLMSNVSDFMLLDMLIAEWKAGNKDKIIKKLKQQFD